jgi:hypothetical protein
VNRPGRGADRPRGRCDVIDRIQKVLEDANINLSGVVMDTLGKSAGT